MQDTVSFWKKFLRIRAVILEESGQQRQNSIQMWYEYQYTHTICSTLDFNTVVGH